MLIYPTCCPLVRFSHIGSIEDAARDGPCAHGKMLTQCSLEKIRDALHRPSIKMKLGGLLILQLVCMPPLKKSIHGRSCACQTSKTRVRARLEIRRARALRTQCERNTGLLASQHVMVPFFLRAYPTCCPLVRFSHGSIEDAARDGPCAHGNLRA